MAWTETTGSPSSPINAHPTQPWPWAPSRFHSSPAQPHPCRYLPLSPSTSRQSQGMATGTRYLMLPTAKAATLTAHSKGHSTAPNRSVVSSVSILSFGGNYPCLLFSCQSTSMVFHFTFVLGSQLTLRWSDRHRLKETPAHRPSPGPALPGGRKQPAPTKALSSSATSSPPIISWTRLLSFCISTAPHLLNILWKWIDTTKNHPSFRNSS